MKVPTVPLPLPFRVSGPLYYQAFLGIRSTPAIDIIKSKWHALQLFLGFCSVRQGVAKMASMRYLRRTQIRLISITDYILMPALAKARASILRGVNVTFLITPWSSMDPMLALCWPYMSVR